MKRVLYIIIIVLIILAAYMGVYSYLKKGGVKILEDNSGVITKQSDTFLHYKVLNKKLLYDYGIDFRALIINGIKDRLNFADSELKRMEKHPRKLNPNKYAEKFIFILINPKDKSFIIKSNLKKYNGDIFEKADKTDLKRYIISLEEVLLDHEWKNRLTK